MQPKIDSLTSQRTTQEVVNTENKISGEFYDRLSRYLQEQNDLLYQRLENERKDREERQKQVFNNFQLQLQKQIEKLMKKQLTNVIIPAINTALTKNIEEKIKKIYTTDPGIIPRIEICIKDSLQKNSTTAKQITDDAFKNHFTKVLAPAFDKSCQEIFRQLQETTEKGLTEMQKQQSEFSSKLPKAKGDRNAVEGIGYAIQTITKISDQMNNVLVNTQTKILKEHQERMQALSEGRQVETNLKPKPQPKVDRITQIKENIMESINSNDYERGFTLALTSQNLQLLTWLISSVDPDKVFLQRPTLLSQNIIVSLIQQISCSLSTSTTKKLDWLHLCLLDLEPTDSSIRPYIQPVLSGLLQHLGSLDSEYSRDSKMLIPTIKKIMAQSQEQ